MKLQQTKKKIGFVLECQRYGADHQILEHVVAQDRPDIQAIYNFQRNKLHLFNNVRETVAALIEIEQCGQVFVVWDLMPCDDLFCDDGKPCRRKERLHILAKLEQKHRAKTTLLCVTHEIEAWLLADGTAIMKALSTTSRSASNIGDDKTPERHKDPKKVLTRIFQNNGKSRGYEHVPWAKKIIKDANLEKIQRRAPSFARLRDKLRGI